jgi:hypothetical protein
VEGTYPHDKYKTSSMASPQEPTCKRSSARTRLARTGTVFILICSGTVLQSGVFFSVKEITDELIINVKGTNLGGS